MTFTSSNYTVNIFSDGYFSNNTSGLLFPDFIFTRIWNCGWVINRRERVEITSFLEWNCTKTFDGSPGSHHRCSMASSGVTVRSCSFMLRISLHSFNGRKRKTRAGNWMEGIVTSRCKEICS